MTKFEHTTQLHHAAVTVRVVECNDRLEENFSLKIGDTAFNVGDIDAAKDARQALEQALEKYGQYRRVILEETCDPSLAKIMRKRV